MCRPILQRDAYWTGEAAVWDSRLQSVDSSAVDDGLLRWINGWPEWMAPAMRFLSEATDYLWFKIALILMLLAMMWIGIKSRRAAVQALIAVLLANELTDVLKASFLNKILTILGSSVLAE